jgi:formylglycine-generating enzyme required for sulfatase activity
MISKHFLIAIGVGFLAACSGMRPHPVAGEAIVSKQDDMRLHYVPAGTFMMGNDAGWAGQKPAHKVNLDAFWIDETEVTNRMYALCVQAGTCPPPRNVSSYTRESYYLDAQYAQYPVVYVSWQEAATYCGWAGRELPGEAQWEKAARGTDGRLYPWGNQVPDQRLLNQFEVSFLDDTVQVGSYPQGASSYGVLDMAGTVWEWTADWFDVYPNGDPSASENFGQTYRVLRGGSFVDAADATTRYANEPELRMHDIGFRCVVPTSNVR